MSEIPNGKPVVSPQDRDSENMDRLIGRVLQGGVLLAALVVLIGGLGLLITHGAAPAAFQTFRGEAGTFTDLASIFRGVGAGESRAVTQLGLLLLIATPVARVALTLGAFIQQRDRLYVGVTALVLSLLLYGLLWGAG